MSLRIVTSPEEYAPKPGELAIFLGGGIQHCPDWQAEVCRELGDRLGNIPGRIVVFNPRRPEFNMADPNAGREQIEWEFRNLGRMGIFSMLFWGTADSGQPICFYELGRYVETMKRRFPRTWHRRIVVSVSNRFPRRLDVAVQLRLATNGQITPIAAGYHPALVSLHAEAIAEAVEDLCPLPA